MLSMTWAKISKAITKQSTIGEAIDYWQDNRLLARQSTISINKKDLLVSKGSFFIPKVIFLRLFFYKS